MKTRIIPFERGEAAWHLAVEEALFQSAKQQEQPTPTVRMYSFSKPSVILGYAQRISEVNLDYCKENKVDVTMRCTGGGSVYLSPKELQYSIITPEKHSLEFLKNINTKIINALQDNGYSPQLKTSNNHPVIRMNDKSFIFDAQRRGKNVLLHHGTTMVDREQHIHQFPSLNATSDNKLDISLGMLWLTDIQEVREKKLVKAYEKNFPDNSFFVKSLASEEIKLAKKLYKSFYNNKKAISFGKKNYGICYLPSTQYNMEEYSIKE